MDANKEMTMTTIAETVKEEFRCGRTAAEIAENIDALNDAREYVGLEAADKQDWIDEIIGQDPRCITVYGCRDGQSVWIEDREDQSIESDPDLPATAHVVERFHDQEDAELWLRQQSE
jgi:light-regulated signal transduction histidine kinase (bacteriophytochrome)